MRIMFVKIPFKPNDPIRFLAEALIYEFKDQCNGSEISERIHLELEEALYN